MPGSPATLSRLTPILTTDDMDATIAFYRDVLDFEVTGKLPEENPTWCFLRRDDAAIMFTSPEEHDHDHDEDDDHGHDHEHPESSGDNRLWTMYVYSDDVEVLWEELRDKPNVAYPLYDTHYGMREFGIRDPNGFALSFGKEV
jgi:uncharacterized glyoxalase superfamily protein PhnB